MGELLVVNIVLLWILVVFNIVLTLALIRKQDKVTVETLPPGTIAPEFSVETLKGDRVSLNTYRSNEIAFLFISPNCRPCLDSMSYYKEMEQKLNKTGYRLQLVSIGDRPETEQMARTYNLNQDALLLAPESSNPFFNIYKIPGTPSYCIINADGTIRAVGAPFEGDMGWKLFRDSILTGAGNNNENEQGS